jgi:hypothetical protein
VIGPSDKKVKTDNSSLAGKKGGPAILLAEEFPRCMDKVPRPRRKALYFLTNFF